MLRKAILGVVAMVALVFVSTGTASAYGGHYHGGYGHRGCAPYGYGYGYRGYYGPRYGVGVYAPPVYVNPAPAYGYPGYGYGYGAPGVGVTTPGFGLYVR